MTEVLKGNYESAAKLLKGHEGFNKALVDILNGTPENVNKDLGSCNDAGAAYLKAIVAAREGDNSTAKNFIEKASKCDKLAKRAETDVEFAKVK